MLGSNSVANSRATLAPDNDVSAIRPRHSRVQSSTTVMIRKRRPSVSWSDTKSNGQRWFGIKGSVIGTRVPMARLRPKMDTEAVTIRMDRTLLRAIDDYRRIREDLPLRSEVVRRVMAEWLEKQKAGAEREG